MALRDDIFDAEFLALLERLHLLAKRLARGPAAGQRRSRRIGDGLEFADHRDYAAGDDLRFVNWPYYARMEKLLLRMFHEHSDQGVFVMMDSSASMGRAKFNYARRTAAALAYVAMGNLERVVLQPFSNDLAAPLHTGRNRAQILPVLDFLAALAPAGQTDLSRCAQRLASRQDFGGTVLIVSDLLDCGDQVSDALARLRPRCEPTVIHLFAPEDAEPAIAGQVRLHHAETAREMNLDVTPELLESYRQRWQEFCRGCQQAVQSRGGTYVSASTALPFEKLVLGALRQAGVLE